MKGYLYVLVIVGVASYCGTYCGVNATLGTEIRSLIDQETTLRQTLVARLQGLKQRTASLNSSVTPCTCPTQTTVNTTSKQQVAYTGTSHPTLSSLTTATHFNFSSDLINVGKPFDLRDGHFRVSVSGLYGFSLTVYMSPRYWVSMELVVDNKHILGVKTGHYYASRTNRQVNMATNFVIVYLTAGAEVWPRYVAGSRYLYGEGVTTFSGYLLHEM